MMKRLMKVLLLTAALIAPVAAQQIGPPPSPVGGVACTGDFCTATAPLSGALGGTGVANTSKTLTLGGNLTTSGAFASTFTMTGITGVTFPTSGTLATTSAANIPLSALAAQATNTIVGNATAGSASPTALTIGSCSTAASALLWTTSSGFSCNTSITAAALPVGGVTGLGTGVATALGVNVGTAGAFVVNGGALGTPSGGTGTNITGVNAALLNGATFAAPGAIGGGTPGTIAGTTITATSIALGGGTALANYVQGTWTPAIAGSSTAGTPTYGTQVGSYTRIGNRVEIDGRITISAFGGSPTGNAIITGLPIAVGSSSAACSIGQIDRLTHAVTFLQFGIVAITGTSQISIYEFGVAAGSGDTASVPVSAVGTTFDMVFSCAYKV